MRTVAVWDLPTRAFHWALVAFVTCSIITATVSDDLLSWHQWSGMAILSLLVFRVMWGVIGGTHARFASFVRGPRTVLLYARELRQAGSKRFLGHNPLGGWSVVLMLLSLSVQACTGLFANDDVSFEGPLASRVSKEMSDFLTHIHHFNANVLYVLIGMHVAAIIFYLVRKREDLVRPMITGSKECAGDELTDSPGVSGSIRIAAVLIVVAAAAVYAITRK